MFTPSKFNAPLIPSRHVVVTGASGYIGWELCRRLVGAHVAITVLGRSPLRGLPGFIRHVSWQLGESVPSDTFHAVEGWPPADAVFHLAHIWQTADTIEQDINVRGTELLLQAARGLNLRRFVFASSLSARADALNRYGRIKAAIEQKLDRFATVARIGLVYGGRARGQWGTLVALSRLPILPMVDPSTKVQPIHVADLCEALIRLGDIERPPCREVALGDPIPIAFGDFLRMVCRTRSGRRLLILPIPAGVVLRMVDLAAHVPGLPSLDRERILGLMGIRTCDTHDSLNQLSLSLRTLTDGLKCEAYERRRVLLQEGRTLMTYLLGKRPETVALRAYTKSVELFWPKGPDPRLSSLAHRFPIFLQICDPIESRSILAQRLDVALRILELVALQELEFKERSSGWLPTLLSLASVAVLECVLLPVRLLGSKARSR